jgi:hypothetical protein
VVEGDRELRAMAVREGQEGAQGPAKDFVSALMRAERTLRELAADLQLRKEPFREVKPEDVLRIQMAELALYSAFEGERGWFQNVSNVLAKAARAPEEFGPDAEKTVNRLRRFYSLASSALFKARYVADKCAGLPYDDDFCIHIVRREGVPAIVEELMGEVRSLTGRECGFGLRIPEKRRKYDLPSLLNDVSNCVHVVAEWFPRSGLPTLLTEAGERCFAYGDADKGLLDLCSLWEQKVRELKEKGAYAEEDYSVLTALVGPEEATFRVGSSRDHATRVSKDGRFVYYDIDAPVSNTVEFLMESMGYRCTVPSSGMLVCSPPGPDALGERKVRERIADVMSWVTSADFRLQNGFRNFCEMGCREKKRVADESEFEWCVDECVAEMYKEEMKKRWEAEKGTRVRPHPVVESDLKKFGITWYR